MVDAELIKAQEIQDQMNELADQHVEILKGWANRTCPLKVGNEITVPLSAYTHAGKKAVVDRITYEKWSFRETGYCWLIWFSVISKGGQKSKLTGKFRQDQWERETEK